MTYVLTVVAYNRITFLCSCFCKENFNKCSSYLCLCASCLKNRSNSDKNLSESCAFRSELLQHVGYKTLSYSTGLRRFCVKHHNFFKLVLFKNLQECVSNIYASPEKRSPIHHKLSELLIFKSSNQTLFT